MSKALLVWLQLSLGTVVCLFTSPLLAQVTTDGTVNTQVNQNGNVTEITGGETRGSNLFHSFQDFSVPAGNEAYFNNAENISDIFSRVTGGNISNIDGLIRANGTANLFLINPAGIVFGENAQLNIGGSFYGSSASSILFEDGEFSAVDNLEQPILTINAPIGLNFRDEPGDIVNRSIVQNSNEEVIGLEVAPGNNLTLVGGNLNFEGGNLTARGGNIELASLSEAGVISLGEDGSLSFPDNIARGDITLSNGSEVDVSSSGGGNINVNVGNLNLEIGERGASRIRAGISPNSTLADAQAGDININATGNISLNGGRITNNQGGLGNAGNIDINTDSLSLQNGGDVNSSIFGQGNAGTVNVTATGDLTADGESSPGFSSGIFSQVTPSGVGNAGGITISADNLSLTNGGAVDAGTVGQGNAGAVNVTVTGDLTADGEDSQGIRTGIFSQVASGGVGNAGGITISADNLSLTNGGAVDANTFGQGNAGAVNVTATGDLTADGEDSQSFASRIISQVAPSAVGNSGGVTISANNLSLTNGGIVDANTFGQGNAGAVNVTATGDLTADGEDSQGSPSGILSQVDSSGVGNAGGVNISANNLSLTNGSVVDASTFGRGNAGNLTIDATESIFISGIQDARAGISASAVIDKGESGDIDITTNRLTITDNGIIEAGNFDFLNNFEPGTGEPGNITIRAVNLDLTNGGTIGATTQSTEGTSGIINLNIAEDITLDGDSLISAQAFGDADGGNLNIDSRFIVAFPSNGTGNDFVATADRGTGGNISLNVEQLFGLSPGRAIERGNIVPLFNGTNDIDVSGNVGGSINITTTNRDPLQGATELPANIVQPSETTQQACAANREAEAKNGLDITGKGGVPPAPELPLNSLNAITNEETNPTSTIPAPIETSRGKIQPARGIEVTPEGVIRLTAYRTNNAGDRLPEIKQNCS